MFCTFTVEPRLATTPLIQPPSYYGHYILVQKKLSQSFSYLQRNKLNRGHSPFFCRSQDEFRKELEFVPLGRITNEDQI